MALGEIPSWLRPTDVLGAIESGARIGLSAAAQRQQADEARNRLGLGYAELGERSSESQQRLAEEEKFKLAQMAMAQANQQRGNYESDRDYLNRLATLGIQRARLETEQSKLGVPRIVHSGTDVFTLDPLSGELTKAITGQSKLAGIKLNPFDAERLKIAGSKVSKATTPEEGQAAQSAFDALQKELESKYLPSTSGTETAAPTPPNPFGGPIPLDAGSLMGTPFQLPTGGAPQFTPDVLAGATGQPPPSSTYEPQGGYKPGTRAVQDGKTYEFDGKDWNPINE